MVLLIAFSFGKRRESDKEPGPANRRIAGSVLRVVDAILHDGKGPVTVVAEWEVTLALDICGFGGDMLIPVFQYETMFRGREGVWEKALEELGRHPYSEVVVISSPRLHLENKVKCGVGPISHKYDHLVGQVGFDRSSGHSSTRGPIRFYYHKARNIFARNGQGRYYWAED